MTFKLPADQPPYLASSRTTAAIVAAVLGSALDGLTARGFTIPEHGGNVLGEQLTGRGLSILEQGGNSFGEVTGIGLTIPEQGGNSVTGVAEGTLINEGGNPLYAAYSVLISSGSWHKILPVNVATIIPKVSSFLMLIMEMFLYC